MKKRRSKRRRIKMRKGRRKRRRGRGRRARSRGPQSLFHVSEFSVQVLHTLWVTPTPGPSPTVILPWGLQGAQSPGSGGHGHQPSSLDSVASGTWTQKPQTLPSSPGLWDLEGRAAVN